MEVINEIIRKHNSNGKCDKHENKDLNIRSKEHLNIRSKGIQTLNELTLNVLKKIADNVFNEEVEKRVTYRDFFIKNNFCYPVVKGYIKNKRKIIVPECPYCGYRHNHGNGGYYVGSITSRCSHCGYGEYLIVLYKRLRDIGKVRIKIFEDGTLP